MRCAHCGSRDTLALVNNFNCLTCGKLTDFEGNKVAPGIDSTGREVIEARLAPREPGVGVVGNLADLQKAGAPEGPDTVGQAAAESEPYQQAAVRDEESADAVKAAAKTTKAAKKK